MDITEFFKFFGLREDTAFEGADCGVERLVSGFESIFNFFHMGSEDGDTFKEFLADFGDFLSILGDIFLFPAIGDGFEECDEGSGGSEDDLVFSGVFDQLRVIFECGGEEGFGGEEHDDEFKGLTDFIPIFFSGEVFELLADGLGMFFEV